MATDTDTAVHSATARRYDLDWLRICAVLLLVPFHSMLVFNQDPNSIMYVKDTLQSPLLATLAGFIHIWHMPLLFVIAGAATWFSLRRRTGGAFLVERLLRLGIPLLFGVLVLVPPMTFLHWWRHANAPSFRHHYQGFFQQITDWTGRDGYFTPAHLWFILFLLLFSVVALPICGWLQTVRGARWSAVVAGSMQAPGMLLLFVLPFALLAALPILGDKNPVYYLGCYLAGVLLVSNPQWQHAIDRHGGIHLWLALMLTPLSFNLGSHAYPAWSADWIGVGLLRVGLRWIWVLAILALGHRYCRAPLPIMPYCNEAAYPCYILHLPVTVLLAFLIIPWQAAIALKFTAITLLSIASTLLLYEAGIRRWPIMRFLFGMKGSPSGYSK